MILEDFLKRYITNSGRWGISKTGCQAESAAIVAMAENISSHHPGVLVVPDSKSAERVAAVMKEVQEITGLRRRIVMIPENGRGKLMYMGDDARRAKALDLLLQGECDMAIASVHAVTGAARSPRAAAESRLAVRRGMTLKMEDLLKRLAAMDYDDECEARVPGEFARRG
ncbi:MAG: hypothetical protein MJ025_06500, partial [Victivallaceae bacterium]|nr:hypothetical protein [Victivallaceae bacterium]